jgi:hypothetical protein
MGGTAQNYFGLTVLPRNVLCVENLTHDTNGVQIVSVHNQEIIAAAHTGRQDPATK